jgi:hypothetical protein
VGINDIPPEDIKVYLLAELSPACKYSVFTEPSGSSKVPPVIVILLESPVIFTPVIIAIS